MNLKEKGIMLYIIEHCKRIEEKMTGVSLECFSSDMDLEDIVLFNIFQIGELVKGLSDDFIKEHNTIPWNKIKGMRDVIAHGYGTINLERTYKTASEDIKPLREYCESIVKN